MKGRLFAFLVVFIIASVSSYFDISAVSSEEERVCLYSSDLESGTLEDWNTMGRCNITLDSGITYNGSQYSMNVTNRCQSWEGPIVSIYPYIVNEDASKVIIKKGEFYTITGYIYAISENAEEPIRCTAKYTTPDGAVNYVTVHNGVVEPNKWVEVSGTIQIPDTEMTAFDIYYEAYNEQLSFNVDSFQIFSSSAADINPWDADNAFDLDKELEKYSFVNYENDFEDGNIEPFRGYLDPKLSIETLDGNKCLKVSNRFQNYSGPALYLNDIIDGTDSYVLKLKVYYESEQQINFKATIVYNLPSGQKDYINVAYCPGFKSGEWNELACKMNYKEVLSMPELLIETDNESTPAEFYIDDFCIKSLSDHKVKKNILKEKKSDFETGIDNFDIYNNASLGRDNTIGFKSKSSLKVSNRQFQSSGAYTFLDFVENDRKYLYSGFILTNDKSRPESAFQMKVIYYQDGVEAEQTIASEKAVIGEWIRLSGEFTLPSNAYSALLLINSPDISQIPEFYLDQVTVIDEELYLANEKNRVTLIRIVVISGTALFLIGCIAFFRKKKKDRNLIKSSNKDGMTNAYNRNAFENEIKKYNENPEECKSIIVTACDLNGLKSINDSLGHTFGDDAIKRCAEVLISAVGDKGKVYRTGGDEFVCITSEYLTEQIKAAFEKEAENDKGYPFSAAVGSAYNDMYSENSDLSIEELLKKADEKMFEHKALLKSKENVK